MYLCIYIATHLHTIDQDGLQGVLWEQFEVRRNMTIE